MYRSLRPLLFSVDPEVVHDLTIGGLERVARNRYLARALARRFRIDDPRLHTRLFGLDFPNPIGLAAGLDKDGRAISAWASFGFGFIEIGSVTAVPQPGNPKPRLFRLPHDEALVNRMGFNNRGAAELARRLRESHDRGPAGMPIMVNVGKSKVVELAGAAADYRRSLELAWPLADAVVLNVSSPNTPGLRKLQAPALLSPILAEARDLQSTRTVPVILKLAPDLEDGEIAELAALAEAEGVSALVAVNTTVGRPALKSPVVPDGGLSGRPLAHRALAVLRLLASRTSLPIISSGGVFDSADAIARIRAGASLVEIYTGFVYGGPGTVRAILEGILAHLEETGVPDVASLRGRDAG